MSVLHSRNKLMKFLWSSADFLRQAKGSAHYLVLADGLHSSFVGCTAKTTT